MRRNQTPENGHLLRSTSQMVPDDAGHAASVAKLAAFGITAGCGDSVFCPKDHTTRGQMATCQCAASEFAAEMVLRN